MTKQEKREYRTEYRERQQLKAAREIVAGKRDGNGRKKVVTPEPFDIPANFTGRVMRDYVWHRFVDGKEVK